MEKNQSHSRPEARTMSYTSHTGLCGGSAHELLYTVYFVRLPCLFIPHNNFFASSHIELVCSYLYSHEVRWSIHALCSRHSNEGSALAASTLCCLTLRFLGGSHPRLQNVSVPRLEPRRIIRAIPKRDRRNRAPAYAHRLSLLALAQTRLISAGCSFWGGLRWLLGG